MGEASGCCDRATGASWRWAWRLCCPTVASGTACAPCARTTPATTCASCSSAPRARWASSPPQCSSCTRARWRAAPPGGGGRDRGAPRGRAGVRGGEQEGGGGRWWSLRLRARARGPWPAGPAPDERTPLAGAHAFHALIELADTQDDGLAALLEGGLGDALEQGTGQDVALSVSGAQTQSFWKIREGISQAQMRAGKAVKHDIALPISAIAAFAHEAEAALRAAQPDVRIINFGHLGDGNLHYNVLLPLDTTPEVLAATTAQFNRIVHDIVAAANGSISAEHGVGQLRRDELRH